MKSISVFFLVVFFTLSCLRKPNFHFKSQVELCGTILSENNEPLPFIDVLLCNFSDTSKIRTNLDGKFKFENNFQGKYSLIINFIGYSKFDSTLLVNDQTPCLKISLLPDTSFFNGGEPLGFNKASAENDIKNNHIRLLFPGGITGASKTYFDNSFEKKYDLSFVRPGCIKFGWDNYTEYNFEIFNCLDSIYGLEWRDDVKSEIVGIEEYIESKKTDTLIITAINLSEDMSALSTKNDEIFVLIYDYSDTKELKVPLVSKKVNFDKNNSTHNLSLSKKDNLILFFIEEDSFREIVEIEPVVRVYFQELIKADSYNKVEKYLGEDDLLGVKIIDKSHSTFTISGSSGLDKYEYSFLIK